MQPFPRWFMFYPVNGSISGVTENRKLILPRIQEDFETIDERLVVPREATPRHLPTSGDLENLKSHILECNCPAVLIGVDFGSAIKVYSFLRDCGVRSDNNCRIMFVASREYCDRFVIGMAMGALPYLGTEFYIAYQMQGKKADIKAMSSRTCYSLGVFYDLRS